jgi:diguanylate cyclase (GGDEF)-like protein
LRGCLVRVTALWLDHRGGRRANTPLWVFLAVEVVLTGLGLSLPGLSGSVADHLLGVIGAAVFTTSVVVRRPSPLVGWLFLAAGAWVVVACTFAVTATFGLRTNIHLTALAPLVLTALVYPLMAIGLAMLSRAAPRASPADILDAAMAALAAFLLLWAFAIAPCIGRHPMTVLAAAAYVLAIVVIFTLAVKLAIAGGMRDPATRLVILSIFALATTSLIIVVPALRYDTPQSSDVGRFFFCVYTILIGSAGLHPRLSQRRYPAPERSGSTPGRMGLFGALALVPAAVWGMELSRKINQPADRVSFLIPVAVSAVFLLFLVARLGLIARVAQERAGELARRSAALAEAASEQRDLQRRLAHRAMHDPLTGLSNRLVLLERMEWALKRDSEACHALLLLDLDGFKDINDTLGHPVGDELLVEVSHRLADAAPPGATLARLGGDEFAVLLEDTESEEAVARAESLVAALRQPYCISGRELFLTTSIGVLAISPGGSVVTPADALRDADLALYAAKAEGKNRVVLFRPDLRAARLDHTRISAGIRHGLAHDEFLLHYQPVIDLETQDIVAVEALIRWEQPTEPLIEPADFVSVAEDTGLIVPLGSWVLRQACQDVREWYHEHRVAVAVNVSGRQLDESGFVEEVLGALADSGLPGRALIIEIAESNLVTTAHADTLYSNLQRLRARGVRVAIDDFGTGYSSLSYVAKLPVDIVKIDKAFTRPSDSTGVLSHDWAFTRAILQMVDSLHLLAVAEGVETAEQAEALRALRCPLVQGYHFARPAAKPVIDRTLAESRSVMTARTGIPPLPGAGPVSQSP